MATRVTPTYARGFLSHAKALSPWPEETTASQAGPRAGEAVPSARSDGSYPTLGLRTSGEQSADSALTVTVRQGGYSGDATFSWSDGLADHRGWDNAIHVSTYEPVEWVDGARYPHAAATPDGHIYVITYRPADFHVRIYRRDPDSGNWTDTGPQYTAPEDPGQTLYGCLAVDGSGAIWSFYWVVEVGQNVAQVRVEVRRPGGAWQTVQTLALAEPVSVHPSTGYTLGRLRAAINADGQVLLLAHLIDNGGGPSPDTLYQWAAEHPSAPLREVATNLGGRGYPDVVVKDGAFWCFYLTYDEPSPSTAYGDPLLRVVGNAFESIETAEVINIPEGLVLQEARVDGTPAFTEGELAAVVAEDGTVYLYTQHYGGAAPDVVYGHVYRFRGTLAAPKSTIQANGWDALGSGSAATWHKNHPTADTTEYPSNFCACVHRGRVAIFANPKTTVSATESYLIAYYMGGYSTAARPSRYLSQSDPDRDPLEYVYVPIAGPAALGFTETSSGTHSATISDGHLDLSTTIGTKYYDVSAAGGNAGYARFKVDVSSGSSLSADAVALRLNVTDGANIWGVTVRVALSTTLQFRVVDTAGTTILDDVDTGQTEPIEIMVSLIQISTVAHCFVFWRVWSTSEDTVWTEAQVSSAIPSGVGTTASLRFGHIASGSSASRWGYVLWSWDGGDVNLARLDRPSAMPGAPLSASPRYVADGVSIAMTDGPGSAEDEFTINTAYEYGIDRLDPRQYPSPSEAWHSLTDAEDQAIAYVTNPFAEDAQLDTDVVGLYVDGANMRGLFLERWDAALADWEVVGELDLKHGRENLPFLRRGDTITPDPDGTYTDEPWFAAGELVGHTVDLGDQALRRVRWNTEGWWSVRTGRRRVVIQLEDVDTTEPSDGVCDIWSSRGELIVHLAGVLQGGFRIYIPDQPTVDGYFSLGIAMIGPVTTFARDFGLGGQETRSAIAELTTLANGYSQARTLGPTARTWGIPLTEICSEKELYDGDGRYMIGTDTSGGLVLANRGDEWSKLDGLLQYAEGPVNPVVYFPLVKLSDGTEDIQIYTAERHSLYGRMSSELSRDLEWGPAEDGWDWRGANVLVITEER